MAVVLGVTVLVLFLTVFKIKNPEMTLNGIHIDQLFVPGLGTIGDPTISVNATLTADISIKNPNIASFRFWNSTTDFFYDDVTVGYGYAPDGSVKALHSVRMNVTVDVLADRVLVDTNATGSAVFNGGMNMSSYTDISGRVNVLDFYKQNFDVQLNCTFTLDVFGRTINDSNCHAEVR